MENDIYRELGPRLAGLRQKRGLSQRALAEKLSVTRQAVSNWERGATIPDVATLCRIGEVLGVDWNELMGSAPPPPQKQRKVPARRAAAFSLAGIFLGVALVGGLWLGSIPPQAKVPENSVLDETQAETTGHDPAVFPHRRTRQKYNPRFWVSYEKAIVEDVHSGHIIEPDMDSPLRQSAIRLSQVLSTITRTGEIELTEELRTAFAEAGEGCGFCYLPPYENGQFEDPYSALVWLYGTGHTGGWAFTTGQVDAWLNDWFGPEVKWTHEAIFGFPLRDGVYIPDGLRVNFFAPFTYDLQRLERREDGSFWTEIVIDGGSRYSPRTLTLVLTAEEAGPQFSRVSWSKEPNFYGNISTRDHWKEPPEDAHDPWEKHSLNYSSNQGRK